MVENARAGEVRERPRNALERPGGEQAVRRLAAIVQMDRRKVGIKNDHGKREQPNEERNCA